VQIAASIASAVTAMSREAEDWNSPDDQSRETPVIEKGMNKSKNSVSGAAMTAASMNSSKRLPFSFITARQYDFRRLKR
jgi:hypothetical protein